MRKSIITAAVAAVLAISFSNSEASLLWDRNSRQTENDFTSAFGPVQSEFAECILYIKELKKVVENKPASGKITKKFVKSLEVCLDDFSKNVKEKTLAKGINTFAAAQVQGIVTDPQFPAKRDAILASLQRIMQKLDVIVKAPAVNPVARNTMVAQHFMRFVSTLAGMLNAIQAAPVTPVYTPGASAPVSNYGAPTYNYGAPAAPAPAPAAPAGRGRR